MLVEFLATVQFSCTSSARALAGTLVVALLATCGPAYAAAPAAATVPAAPQAYAAVAPPTAATVTLSMSAATLPTISGSPPATGQIDKAYSFTPSASSPRGGKLTFSIVNKPNWGAFSTSTGTLSGTPRKTQTGRYGGIVVSVSDGTARAALVPFSITVSSTMAPPTISGTPTTSVQATNAYSFTPSAASPRRAAMAFAVSNKPSWASFNTATGQLSGTPSAANAGTYSGIVISVNDGTASASLAAFTVAVMPAPPTIGGTPAASVNAGSAYSFTPAASSPSGGRLTFSVSNKPSWAAFNTADGRLSGTPAASSEGTYANVSISVSDGRSSASLRAFTITVAAGTSGSATLDWTPPTTRTDGSALTNLAGYRLHYGNSVGSYPYVVTLSNPGLSSYVIAGLASGTWYFVATAFDSKGVESGLTNAVAKTIP